MLALAVQHFARHQHRELITFFQFAEIHLPLHGLNHCADFRAGQPGIFGAGDEASAHRAFDTTVNPIALLHFAAHFETRRSAIVSTGFTAGYFPGQTLQVTFRA